jgi:hypothetical protein
VDCKLHFGCKTVYAAATAAVVFLLVKFCSKFSLSLSLSARGGGGGGGGGGSGGYSAFKS